MVLPSWCYLAVHRQTFWQDREGEVFSDSHGMTCCMTNTKQKLKTTPSNVKTASKDSVPKARTYRQDDTL